jgi:hypothetical protein
LFVAAFPVRCLSFGYKESTLPVVKRSKHRDCAEADFEKLRNLNSCASVWESPNFAAFGKFFQNHDSRGAQAEVPYRMSEYQNSGGGGDMEQGEPDQDGFITDPRDTDVLCGRGGAALRHPGNQTYRRLVNLNKGLYTTCLKTEKLKISRSIVAAIREQNGRFLEKNNDESKWYDIGDKKAVEKTSQALREGQPKLRQKIAEMGSVAVQQANIDYHQQQQQYAMQQQQQEVQQQQQQEIMSPPQQQITSMQQQLMRQRELIQHHQQQRSTSNSSFEHQIGSLHGMDSTQGSHSGNSRGRQQDMLQGMSPAVSAVARTQEIQADMLKRLSLQDYQAVAAATGDIDLQQHNRSGSGGLNPSGLQHQQFLQRMRPSLTDRASLARELGIAESQLSLMSDYSAFGGSIASSGRAALGSIGSLPVPNISNSVLTSTNLASTVNESQGIMSIDSSFKRQLMGLPLGSINTLQSASDHFSIDNGTLSTGGGSSVGMRFSNTSAAMAAAAAAAVNNSNNIDRRRVFAKMKYTRPPSVRSPKPLPPGSIASVAGLSNPGTHLTLDGMPDFHMLESNMSM